MTASLPDQDKLSRIEAAAYLTTLGYKVKPSTLAKYADSGPKFSREAREEGGRRVFYLKTDLNQWAHDHPPTLKSGRPKDRANGQAVDFVPVGTSRRLPSELSRALQDHIVLAEQFASGTANASIGFHFARSLAMLRKLVG